MEKMPGTDRGPPGVSTGWAVCRHCFSAVLAASCIPAQDRFGGTLHAFSSAETVVQVGVRPPLSASETVEGARFAANASSRSTT
jgi:hypothetical protein